VTYPTADEHLSVARRLLHKGSLMFRVLLVVFLVGVASATGGGTAFAQTPVTPAQIPTQQQSTVKAQEVVYAANRRVSELAAQRKQLAAQYEGELVVIDRLKQKKKSWNQERELKDKLSAGEETATKLHRLDRQLEIAQAQLVGARRMLVTAIDAELATRPPGPRADVLARLRTQLVPRVTPSSAHRIAIPSLEVDPSADPEDLDAQAAALRQIEAELQRQINSLDKQSKDLERVAELRRSHDRTIALDRREDNTPTRNTPAGDKGGSRGLSDAESGDSSPQNPGPPGESTSVPTSGDMGFESEATIVLQDVVDPSTIDTLTTAQRSGDPSKRSKAAAKTRDAVKSKLDLLRQKRALIESRAKQLRK
jgi:hypothetical protein